MRAYPYEPLHFTVGLDLGQSSDFTALVALAHEPDGYTALMIERWRGEPYTAIPRRLDHAISALRHHAHAAIFHREGVSYHLSKVANVDLCVDATGVGAAVVDLLEDQGFDPVPITIHGGFAVSDGTKGGYNVPKADLVTTVEMLLQQGRLRIPASLRHAKTLRSELGNFRYTISASGHTRYAAGETGTLEWRERPHDDIVLALACAAWHAEREAGTTLDAETLLRFAWKGDAAHMR